MTPLEITMILSVHCCGDYRMTGAQDESPAGKRIREQFISQGLVEGYQKGDAPMKYKLTKRGEVFVGALMSLPLPVEQTTWVIPKTES